MLGMPCVKRGGKMVAGYNEGAMVFKLTDADRRAEALALDGAHLFDPSGKGQPASRSGSSSRPPTPIAGSPSPSTRSGLTLSG